LLAKKPEPGDSLEVTVECEDGRAFAHCQCREQAISDADSIPTGGTLRRKLTGSQVSAAVGLQVNQRLHCLQEPDSLLPGLASRTELAEDQAGSCHDPLS
jgi:hypothetical protein